MYLLVDGEPEMREYVGPRRHQNFCSDLHGSEREWEIEPLIRSPRRTECLMTGDLTGAGALLQWRAYKRIANVGQFLMPSIREAFKHTPLSKHWCDCLRDIFTSEKNPYLVSEAESIRTYSLVHLWTWGKALSHRGHLRFPISCHRQ